MIDFGNSQEFERFYNDSPCAYATVDKSGNILQVNQTFLNLLDYTKDELIGKKLFIDFLSIADRIYYDTVLIPLLLMQGSAKEISLNLKSKNNIKVPTLINVNVFKKDIETYFNFTIINITQRKSYENELLIAKRKAETLAKNLDYQISIIEQEIEKATLIQRDSLPQSIYDQKNHLSIDFMFFPLDNVSGDFLDYFKLQEDYYRIFIADATGHGLQAGFQTMGIQAQYQKIKDIYTSPSEILTNLNESTIKIFKNKKIIFTCCVVDIDLKNNKLSYASAGHPPQILIQNSETDLLPATGPLIGFKNGLNYFDKSIELENDFLLAMYTDGIVETMNSDGKLYEEERFLNITKNYFDESKNLDYFKYFYNDLDQFRGASPIRDDITLIKTERRSV